MIKFKDGMFGKEPFISVYLPFEINKVAWPSG